MKSDSGDPLAPHLRANRAKDTTWLAMGLAFAYLMVMAVLMWLFENAIAFDSLTAAIVDPRRLNLWLLILLSSILLFVFTSWALGRIGAAPAPQMDDVAGSAEPDRQRTSWLLLGVLATLLMGTGGYVMQEQEKTIAAAQYGQIAAVAGNKAQVAARWVSERRRDMRTLLENERLVADVAALSVRGAKGHDGKMSIAALDAMVRAQGFVGAVIVDPRGRTIYSVPDDLSARAQCVQAARANGLDASEPLALSRAFDPEDGSPRLLSIAHLFTSQGRPRHVATICVRIDLGDRLLPSLASWPMPTETGSVLLGRPDGDDVLVLNSPGSDSAAWGVGRLPQARARWQAALVATSAGELHERELDDERVMLRAAVPVDGTPWIIMARMDAAEADRLQAHGQRRIAVGAGFAFIFAVAVAMLGWARSSSRSAGFTAERIAMIRRLEELAHNDSLTGLPRRELTEDRLRVAVAQARRDNDAVGVLFVDLDGFKGINDQHGHAAGDAVLKAMAERLGTRLREGDTAGRVGGDEFLIVLPRCGDAKALTELGGQIVDAVAEPLIWNGLELTVLASVGGALFPNDGADGAALTHAADQAMYRAKQAGGGYAAAAVELSPLPA